MTWFEQTLYHPRAWRVDRAGGDGEVWTYYLPEVVQPQTTDLRFRELHFHFFARLRHWKIWRPRFSSVLQALHWELLAARMYFSFLKLIWQDGQQTERPMPMSKTDVTKPKITLLWYLKMGFCSQRSQVQLSLHFILVDEFGQAVKRRQNYLQDIGRGLGRVKRQMIIFLVVGTGVCKKQKWK